MAWLRTILIVSIVGLLLWRLAYVDGREWWSLALLVPSLAVVSVGVVRMRELSRDGAGDRRMAPLAWALGGFLALSVAGVILAAA